MTVATRLNEMHKASGKVKCLCGHPFWQHDRGDCLWFAPDGEFCRCRKFQERKKSALKIAHVVRDQRAKQRSNTVFSD